MIRKLAWDIYGKYAWDDNRMESTFFQSIVKQLNRFSAPLDILDAGCGTGEHAKLLADLQHTVTGIDFSTEMIKKARNRISKNNKGNLNFVKCDLNNILPFKDSSYDMIISISVLQNVKDPLGTLSELNRILRRKGEIILVHFPPYLKNVSLKKEVGNKFRKSKKKKLSGKILLFVKSYLERIGMTEYWSEEQVENFLILANFHNVQVLKKEPIILLAQKV